MATADLNSLLRRTTIDDHEEVLAAANSALKKSPRDTDLLHSKLVALLKLDRFDDALRVLDVGGEDLQKRARLEHAYALYKAGQLEDVSRVIGTGPTTRALRHVEAQTWYRAEEFESAATLYKELASGAEGEEHDLRINSRAVDAQLEWAGKGELVERKKPGREDLEAFETAYNTACACVARGELGQGEVLLKRAKGIFVIHSCKIVELLTHFVDLCNALDDMSADEKKVEILPITVQQIYVLSLQGKTQELEQLRNGINISEYANQTSLPSNAHCA